MNKCKKLFCLLLLICFCLITGCVGEEKDSFKGLIAINQSDVYEIGFNEKTTIKMSIFTEEEVYYKAKNITVSCQLCNFEIEEFNYSFKYSKDETYNEPKKHDVEPNFDTCIFTINKNYFNNYSLELEVTGVPLELGIIRIIIQIEKGIYEFADIPVVSRTEYHTAKPFKYTLNDYNDAKNQAYNKLAELKEAFDNDKSEEVKADLENDFLDYYEIIQDECTKAMMLYNNDLTNTVYKEQYESLDKLANDLYTKYYKLFADNPDDYDEMARLLDDNTRIELEYDKIDDYKIDSQVLTLYEQVVKNNKRIAEINGYNNYMDYAYEKMYHRDYTPEEAKNASKYIKNVVVRAYKNVVKKIESAITYLNEDEYNDISKLLEKEYKYIEEDYLTSYSNIYSSKYREAMLSMFNSGNVLFANNVKSRGAAYTTSLNSLNEPVAYFGKGYQNMFTIVHEMGHYINEYLNDDNDLSYELYETHSQGNEIMFLSYIKGSLSNKIYNSVYLFKMYDYLKTILLASAVNEFEQYVYSNDVSSQKYDKKFTEICDKYEIKDYEYWRYVAVTSCAYYISYAVSLVPLINLYKVAINDFNKAQEMYIYMIEGEEKNYFERLEKAGLANPLMEETYNSFSFLIN